jgi:hypothetical protein
MLKLGCLSALLLSFSWGIAAEFSPIDLKETQASYLETSHCHKRYPKVSKRQVPIVANILGADELDANNFLIWQSLNVQGTTGAGFQVGGFAANTTQVFLPVGPATYILTLTVTASGTTPLDLVQVVDVTNGFPGKVIALFPPFDPLLASQSVLITTTHPATIIALQDLSVAPTITSFSLSIAANASL